MTHQAFQRRLRRLEQGRADICPVCRGVGKYVVCYEGKPVPPGCPECGKAYEIHIRYVEESLPKLEEHP